MAAPATAQIPIPKFPYYPPPQDLVKRVPGLDKWYEELHKRQDEWVKQLQVTVFGVTAN